MSKKTRRHMKKYRRQQSKHWPTGGDLKWWQVLLLPFKRK